MLVVTQPCALLDSTCRNRFHSKLTLSPETPEIKMEMMAVVVLLVYFLLYTFSWCLAMVSMLMSREMSWYYCSWQSEDGNVGVASLSFPISYFSPLAVAVWPSLCLWRRFVWNLQILNGECRIEEECWLQQRILTKCNHGILLLMVQHKVMRRQWPHHLKDNHKDKTVKKMPQKTKKISPLKRHPVQQKK